MSNIVQTRETREHTMRTACVTVALPCGPIECLLLDRDFDLEAVLSSSGVRSALSYGSSSGPKRVAEGPTATSSSSVPSPSSSSKSSPAYLKRISNQYCGSSHKLRRLTKCPKMYRKSMKLFRICGSSTPCSFARNSTKFRRNPPGS
jgi:hypothetical protein